MTDEEEWEKVVVGIKKLETNRYEREIKPQEIELKKDKDTSVPFNVQKRGRAVLKDDFSEMDGRLAKRFKREEFKVQAVLDLHGLTEKSAYNEVMRFVKSAYIEEKRCILIITGKGYDDTLFSEKGVLRKSVPLWLSSSEINSLILAYKNPSEKMGGMGAIYILLRKKI